MDAHSSGHRTDTPHPARMYDYYLGGKDWFAADRDAAEQAMADFPTAPVVARENRAFMRRAVAALAGEHGVRQFLDIGTGLPTEPNLHQIAQREAPECSVVYVDNDPLVIEYADVLMRAAPGGAVSYVEADLRYDALLEEPRLREALDLSRPVALCLVALLHFVEDERGPHALVRGLLDRLAPGSYLVLSHTTDEFAPERARAGEEIYGRNGIPYRIRSRTEIARFFDGLELLEPGVTTTHAWRPEEPSPHSDRDVSTFAGVARKR